MNNKCLPMMFFGHHKCATETIRAMLSAVAEDLCLRCSHYAFPAQFDGDLKRAMEKAGSDFYMYTNAECSRIKEIEFYRGFHIIRDPRDIIISAYFSHKQSHPTVLWPELGPHRESLMRLTLEEGLFAEMDFCSQLPTAGYDLQPMQSMRDWDYSMENCKEIRFEDFAFDPYDTMLSVFEFMGLVEPLDIRVASMLRYSARKTIGMIKKRLGVETLSVYKLPRMRALEIVYDYGFKRQTSGRNPGVENASQHLRKGTPEEWKKYFNEEHVEYFKKLFPDVVSTLGYETDENWSAEEKVKKVREI